MSAEKLLDRDVPCERCKYNLRTLPMLHRCPECGFPVLRSVIAADILVCRRTMPLVRTADLENICFITIATATGLSSHALKFTSDAVRIAVARRRRFMTRIHLSARQVCLAVRDHAVKHFRNGPEASAALHDWNLETSDKIGIAIAALIEAGLIRPDEASTPDEFNNLLTHDQLMRALPE